MDKTRIDSRFFNIDDVADDGVYFVANDDDWCDGIDLRKYAKLVKERHLEKANESALDALARECKRL